MLMQYPKQKTDYTPCLITLPLNHIAEYSDNKVHFSCVIINKLLYSLPPSVGQSAAELMQVTSGKRPGCTQGCCSGRFMCPPDAEASTATDCTAAALTHSAVRSPELTAGAICLTVKQKRVSGRSLDETEFRSAGSHTSSALLSRGFDSVAFSEEPAEFPLGGGENLKAPCQFVFSVFS